MNVGREKFGNLAKDATLSRYVVRDPLMLYLSELRGRRKDAFHHLSTRKHVRFIPKNGNLSHRSHLRLTTTSDSERQGSSGKIRGIPEPLVQCGIARFESHHLTITSRNQRPVSAALEGDFRKMARLNIEDSFWEGIMTVVAKVGDQDRAIGNALRFFRHSQRCFKESRLMTEAEFKASGFLEALFPEIAERVDGGIQAVGAEEHFNWLRERVDAGREGGKVSAKRPRDARGRLLSNESKQNPSKAKQHQASFSSSLSLDPTLITRSVSSRPAEADRGSGSIYQSVEELRAGLGSKKIAEWFGIYPDTGFIEHELAVVFQHYSDKPDRKPGTRDAWIRAVAFHLRGAWEKHKNLAARDKLLTIVGGKERA